jgi:uncharacterized protein (DUF1697 family)
MDEYVALLRGINVGGHHKVLMAELRNTLEGLGCRDVKTILASGNVIFNAKKEDPEAISGRLETELAKKFGFPIPVMLRTGSDISRMLKSTPFKGIEVTPKTRLYVTFLAGKPRTMPKSSSASPNKLFRILRVAQSEVFSVATVAPEGGSVEAMAVLEREFGKNITTRNWNTIVKIGGQMSGGRAIPA